MDISKKILEAGMVVGTLGGIGLIGLVFVIIYGNLSGNVGFSADSQGYNDTEQIIANLTQGYSTFFGFMNTLFTIAAVVLLITMLVGLLYLVFMVIKVMGKKGSGGGYE